MCIAKRESDVYMHSPAIFCRVEHEQPRLWRRDCNEVTPLSHKDGLEYLCLPVRGISQHVKHVCSCSGLAGLMAQVRLQV